MIQLEYIGPTGGDETAPYDVILDKEYTFSEFVQAVVKERPNEWGYIGVYDGRSIFGNPALEYSHGDLKSPICHEVDSYKVTYVTASGGWSRMDYLVWLEK